MTASASVASSRPACASAPVSVAGEISAPCRASPVTREFWLRPATYRSVISIAMKALDNRPLPIAFGGPGAVTVAGTGHRQARRQRRRRQQQQCTVTRTTACQSGTSDL